MEDTERRMAEILSRIEGAGKLQVMLTLKSGSQLELAEDTDRTIESDEQRTKSETVTINRGSGQQDVVITQQRYPVYQGAVVVCQGADRASVRLAVTEAVAALTGLSSDKISVVKWNSEYGRNKDEADLEKTGGSGSGFGICGRGGISELAL